jgi:isoaspartyl peptidase/L-asparaginase-like protein (Ntn-hydrolase superfamily)
MNLSRRRFVSGTAASLFGAATLANARGADSGIKPGEMPLVVSTWPFGKPSNDEALKVLSGGGSILDAIEQGIMLAESTSPNQSVGLGGKPNAAGVVQLDACIMFGPGHKAGSVAGLEGIRHPISAARRVMEKTKHVMLVGEGARMFALEEGLESIPVDTKELYEKWKAGRQPGRGNAPASKSKTHDTIALLMLGADGTVAGGCSTSGLAGKLPGRVGDSPILGSGLYVDNEVGAAGATGVGENVMRYCATFRIVEYMRQGMTPDEACLETIRQIARIDPRPLKDLSINFIALDKHGRYGAAGTDENFKFSVATKADSRVLANPAAEKLQNQK